MKMEEIRCGLCGVTDDLIFIYDQQEYFCMDCYMKRKVMNKILVSDFKDRKIISFSTNYSVKKIKGLKGE